MSWKQLLAVVAALMIILEPVAINRAAAQCASCQRVRLFSGHSNHSEASGEAGCGSARGGLFQGRLFSGRLRSRLAGWRESRRAARHESGCGHASEADCAVPSDDASDETSFVDPTQFEDGNEAPEVPTGEKSPVQDVDYGAAPDETPEYGGSSQPQPGQTAWQPPVPIRVEFVTPPSQFDEPSAPVQTAKSKSWFPAPLGAIVAPF